MELKSIGYKKDFSGARMEHWKLTKGDLEFLVVDAGNLRLVMHWDGYSFDGDEELTDEENETLKVKIGLVPKVREEIEDDKEWTSLKRLYKTGELKEPEPEYVRETGKYSADEVNSLLNLLVHEHDIEYNGKTTITQDMVDEDTQGLLIDLLGYKVEVDTDGSHKNDGQMVEYDFTFWAPSKEIISVTTEMCLMVGFNYHKPLDLNNK